MGCAHNVVRARLPVDGEFTICKVVTGLTLVSHDASAIENRLARGGGLPMWTSLGARPVAALTELL